MFTKIKNIYKSPHVQQFRDMRAVALAGFAIVAVLVAWSTAKAIQTNYELQKQISELGKKNEVQQLENQNVELRNQYFRTDRFLELAARRQFGKAAPGETVLNVPSTVALSYLVDLSSTQTTKTSKNSAEKPAYQRNFQQWINFFFHRGSAGD